MKTKIMKAKGWWKLVVADEAINQEYDCTNKNPIVLGVITNFFDSGCWSLQDYRLTKHRPPSPYLEESVEEYLYKNDKEKTQIISKLHSYRIDEEKKRIIWPYFDSYAFDGDNPSHTSENNIEYNIVARFTFKEAFKRLQEQKMFWEEYQGNDLENSSVKLDNVDRQPYAIEIRVSMLKLTPKMK